MSAPAPLVSVILPTFNRAQFLPQAFASIEAQSFRNWELIVVDDGSTDETESVVQAWRGGVEQAVFYVAQDNRGAYGARNTGLEHARGDYIAFFDSDDVWLPHHLARCVSAFERAPEIDWVFAACRAVDAAGAIVQPTTFETDGAPRPFLSLKAKDIGGVRIIDDPAAIECHFLHGIYCGLQNSVIRRSVFAGHRFWEDFRVVEDVLFLARALARGIRLAYITDVQVLYRIHEGNSSGSASGVTRDGLRRIYQEHVTGLERLGDEVALTKRQRRAFRRCLARHYFWHIGYVCCWEMRDTAGAMAAFKKGLRLTPWDPSMWKTYLACVSKSTIQR